VKKKKKVLGAPSEFSKEYSFTNALKKGDIFTRLSMLVMGAGNIARGQVVKGLLFLGIEVAYLYYMITVGFGCLAELPSLGSKKVEKVYNPVLDLYEYSQDYDQSMLILLYGVATIIISLLFICFLRGAVKSAYEAQVAHSKGRHVNSFWEDIKSLFNENLHKLLLTLPILGVVVFTITPLIYMICLAFTDYDRDIRLSFNPETFHLFDWVGFDAFKDVLSMDGEIGKQFWSVLGWTLIWAVLATFLNYILGMILAIIINRKGTRLKGMWRFLFILSIAIPQFISLMLMSKLLGYPGPLNGVLLENDIIDTAIPFFTNPTYARITVVVVNLWVGIPYTMLQVTGILQNIPADLYEAAKVDGANAVTQFFKITLPYMLFVTGPYLVTTFTGNVNNFNVIFLLTGGGPYEKLDYTAGQTDLLVTWLYKLTIDKKIYNTGAVIGIMTFVVLSIVSIVTYRNTGSYKDEEGFQ
jgi:arabinogalactan oligomer/maltooligosaccharide transport system permease protein